MDTLRSGQNMVNRALAARLEPFDSYWQAPEDVEAGYASFATYYRANYLPWLPGDRTSRILVVSCGPGYLLDILRQAGYLEVTGIDSDAAKLAFARQRGLPCEEAEAFEFLASRHEDYDVIIAEQELNHLTIAETVEFLQLARAALRPGGRVVAYAVNGANPLVGAEGLAQNIDHFYTVTEYSLAQLLQLGGFTRIRCFPLKLYVFYRNPGNYVGLLATSLLEMAMRLVFRLYGKKVAILSKKVGAVGFRE